MPSPNEKLRKAADEFARRVAAELGDAVDSVILYGSVARRTNRRLRFSARGVGRNAAANMLFLMGPLALAAALRVRRSLDVKTTKR